MSECNIEINGDKRWINEIGELHREDGPAIEGFNGEKRWFKKGYLHNREGPAVIYPDGKKEYWINYILYSKESWFSCLTQEEKNIAIWNM